MNPLRILVIGSELAERRRAVFAIEEEVDLAVVGEASAGQDAVVLVASLVPDVVVMDISVRGMAAREATQTIAEGWPTVAVIALTPREDVSTSREMLRAGAMATLKWEEVHKLPQTIRRAVELLKEIGTDRS